MVQKSESRLPPRLIVSFAIVFLLLLVGGVWFYVSEKNRLIGVSQSDLNAIAQLKIDQIVQWRTERLADAAVVSASPLVSEDLSAFQAGEQSRTTRDFLQYLRTFRDAEHYQDVLLVDAAGTAAVSIDGRPGTLSAEDAPAFRLSDSGVHASVTDLSADPKSIPIHLDVVAPVVSAGMERVLEGWVILRVDAQEFLFPLIQSWPTSSSSAETLLVRRDGGDVLFLNDLRHRPDTALKLRIPLSQADVPAVMAVTGRTGLVYGKDYRGEPVVGAIRRVPGSPWSIIAKEDTAELLAPWRLAAALILAVLLGLAASVVGLFLTFWQRSQKSHYAELLRSEERFRVTLMSVGDGVIATDAHGAVTMMNPSAEALTCWTQAEAQGRPLEEVFTVVEETSRRPVQNPARRVIAEGIVVGLANHSILICRDGSERAIADSGAPIRGETGDVDGVVLVFRDVSQERTALKALGESEEHYHSLFSHMLNGFASCRMLYEDGHPHDFIYLDVNAAFSKLTGLKDVKGKKVSEVIPGIRESDPELIQVYGRVASGGPPEQFETYVRALDDWFSISVYSPRQEYFVAVFDVVTERKKSEARRLLLSAAIEQTAEMIVITDSEGMIQYVNPAFETVTGYTRAEAIGRTPRILKSGAHDEGFYGELWQTLASGSAWKGHFKNRKKDGTIYEEEATISPVFDEAGEIVNFVGNKHDISVELGLEAQLRQAQKMESVGRLAGGIAHDFNNMLQVIHGYLEISMKDPALSDGQRRNLVQISSAARRSAELTSQLLAFARKQTINPRILDLNEAVERTTKMLRRLIGEDIELVWKPGAVDGRLKIDPMQLDQVLANLAVNARDAIDGVGSLTLETGEVVLDAAYCALHPGFLPGRFLLLTVSDTGSGMSLEVQAHLFEPFFTTKPIGKGTGLGLATVYGIVKQNAGFINVYSEQGHGTTFRVYLPSTTAETAATGDRALSAGESASRGTETILLVEDEEAILQVSQLILDELGYRVLTAGTPAEAERQAESHKGSIDLLVTDVILPQMNGKELSRRLSELHPRMKCLFMSGYTADVISQRGLLDEGVHFLSKPFTTTQLAEKIREALNARP